MTRSTRGAGAADRKYVARAIRWPPGLWKQLADSVPERERSAFIREAVREALMRRAAERLREYYTTDAETLEWIDFVGDTADD